MAAVGYVFYTIVRSSPYDRAVIRLYENMRDNAPVDISIVNSTIAPVDQNRAFYFWLGQEAETA
jgi:hypothetical protein